MAENEVDVMVATRVSRQIYNKILKRQREAKALIGVAPSVSALVRAMIAEALGLKETKQRKTESATK